VADALHSAAIRLLRGVRKEDVAARVGPARLSALSVLVFGGPMRLTDLARLEQVSVPTMSKIVAGLERAALLRRTPDPDDARTARLEPTARGVRLLEAGRRRRVNRIAAAVDELSASEVETLAQAARLIARLAADL
jgi:DNA-binding MarR family transcriptional regulator